MDDYSEHIVTFDEYKQNFIYQFGYEYDWIINLSYDVYVAIKSNDLKKYNQSNLNLFHNMYNFNIGRLN